MFNHGELLGQFSGDFGSGYGDFTAGEKYWSIFVNKSNNISLGIVLDDFGFPIYDTIDGSAHHNRKITLPHLKFLKLNPN